MRGKKNIGGLRQLLYLIAIFALISLVVIEYSAQSFHPENNTEPTSSPTPTPNSNYSFTPTPKPMCSFSPTSNPTYIPNEQDFSSNGYIFVQGVRIFGGDLQENAIQFNTLYIGDSKNVSFYVQSTSNFPVRLSFLVTDWSPHEIGAFLILNWDYNGLPINPNEEILLTLTLSSPLSEDFANYLISNNVSTFGFIIHVTSTMY
jgi:hypothetical protein